MPSRFLSRIAGAARLEPRTYEDVEADVTANGQAVAVVVLSSGATAIGLMRGASADPFLFVSYTAAALAAWTAWSALVYLIGVHLLPGPETNATVGEVLRTTGFASAPGMVRILGVVPGVGPALFLAGSVWMLVAMFVAIRQALDYRHVTRALAVCVVGWLLSLLFVAIIGLIFAQPVF
jgi:hypothetical protein